MTVAGIGRVTPSTATGFPARCRDVLGPEAMQLPYLRPENEKPGGTLRVPPDLDSGW